MSWTRAPLSRIVLDADAAPSNRNRDLANASDPKRNAGGDLPDDAAGSRAGGGTDWSDWLVIPERRASSPAAGPCRTESLSNAIRGPIRLLVDRSRAEPRYLAWALRSLLDHSNENTRLRPRRLNLEELLQVELRLPPPIEQARFAKLLDWVERLKELSGQADQRRSKLLGAIYRSEFRASDSVDAERVRLGDVGILQMFQPKALRPLRIDEEGTILIGVAGSRCGRVEIVRSPPESPATAVAINSLSPAIDVHYLAETLRQADLGRFAVGSVVPHLTPSALREVEIPLAPKGRQRRFSAAAKRMKIMDMAAASASRRIDRLGAKLMAMAFGEGSPKTTTLATSKVGGPTSTGPLNINGE